MAIGPASLARFEDRLLYHLVAMTGNRPADFASGVSEADLALRLADELHVTTSQAFRRDFPETDCGRRVLVAVEALEGEGFVEAMKDYHPWTIWPTTEGRWEVAQWESRWETERRQRDHDIQAAILRALRETPDDAARLDVDAICASVKMERGEFEENARRLMELGRVAEPEGAAGGLDEGYLRLTPAGLAALEGLARMEAPSTDDPFAEVERLRQRVRRAERELGTAISDQELRRRCLPMLQAEPPYDRLVRTACFVLESRLRDEAGGGTDRSAGHLVEAVLGPGGPVRIAGTDGEQRGAEDLFRGVLELFRNAREGSLARSFSRDDALRLVGTIDLLLAMLERNRSSTT